MKKLIITGALLFVSAVIFTLYSFGVFEGYAIISPANSTSKIDHLTYLESSMPGIGSDSTGGPVFEENRNKWVMWGFEADILKSQTGDYKSFDKYIEASKYINSNSIAIHCTWKMIEREYDRFDFTGLDGYIKKARASKLKAVLYWTSTDYAAGDNEFVPEYIVNDKEKYTRIQGLDRDEPLCPSDPDTLEREKKAFISLLRHLKNNNPDNTVLAVNIGSEMNYLKALKQVKWFPHTNKDIRCSCSNCNKLYQDQGNVQFMKEQYAKYLKELIVSGSKVYDIPMYSPVSSYKYWPGWRYAEDPVIRKSTVDKSNYFVCPSVAETSSAEVFTKEMDHFLPSEIPGNYIFTGGIETVWAQNQYHIEIAPWYNTLWYGGLGAIYRDSANFSITEIKSLREKLRKYWGPLKGIQYYLARLKSETEDTKFWWTYKDKEKKQTLKSFDVEMKQDTKGMNYGVCFQVSENELIFSGSTYKGTYKFSVSSSNGFSGYKFERGYFDAYTGEWVLKERVKPVIEGRRAVLEVIIDSGDYTGAVFRYYR